MKRSAKADLIAPNRGSPVSNPTGSLLVSHASNPNSLKTRNLNVSGRLLAASLLLYGPTFVRPRATHCATALTTHR